MWIELSFEVETAVGSGLGKMRETRLNDATPTKKIWVNLTHATSVTMYENAMVIGGVLPLPGTIKSPGEIDAVRRYLCANTWK